MADDLRSFAWELYANLRAEVISLQSIRGQVTGVKISLIVTGGVLIAANVHDLPRLALTVPAFAALLFDLLIHTYSYSICRTGFYCREHLEPILREGYRFPSEHPLWEEFMVSREAGRNVSVLGNLGLTVLTGVIAVIVLVRPFQLGTSAPSLAALLVLVGWDVWALDKPRRDFRC